MAIFVQDSLNAADLVDITTRSGEIGASWTKHSSYGTGSFRFRNNGVYPYSDASIVYASGVPATDEYDVEVDYHYISNTVAVGIGARIQTNANTLYYVYHNQSEWVFIRCVSGTLTNIGAFAQVLTPNTTYRVKLEIRNTAKKVYVNDQEIMSSADNTITGAGRVGFRSPQSSADNAGKQIRSIIAKDLTPDASGTDADTISASETFDATPNSIGFDADSLFAFENFFPQGSLTRSISESLGASEDISFVNGVVRSDADTIGRTEALSIQGFDYFKTIEHITIEEDIQISTAYPPVVNHLYEDTIVDRTDIIHRLSHQYVRGSIHIAYHHYGIFSDIQSAPLGQFVLGTTPLGEMPPSFNELQDVTNFVVFDRNNIPQAVGTVFTDWELENITATISRDIASYQPLLLGFGINEFISQG